MRKSALIGLFLVPLLIGCGNDSGSTASSPVCSPTAYTPNYAAAPSLTLRRWPTLPVKVFFKTATAQSGTTIEEECRNGFDQWNSGLGRTFWTEVGSAADANLTVEVQNVTPQSTLGITTVFFTSGSSNLNRAEMVIYRWASIPLADYAPTAAHEFGHAMGIGGHSNVSADIMFPTGNASGLLTTPDLNTMRTAYCDFTGAFGKTLLVSRTRSSDLSESFVCPRPIGK